MLKANGAERAEMVVLADGRAELLVRDTNGYVKLHYRADAHPENTVAFGQAGRGAQQHGAADQAQTYREVERELLDTLANGMPPAVPGPVLPGAGLQELEALARDFLARGMSGVTVPPALMLALLERAQLLATRNPDNAVFVIESAEGRIEGVKLSWDAAVREALSSSSERVVRYVPASLANAQASLEHGR
jgi:hypothetical protein